MVEDTQSLAITYQAYLRSSAYDVEWVDNLSDARLSLQLEMPDLVLLDLELPDGNGLELLREMNFQAGETQVVVMSAYGSSDIAEESVCQGAFDYLTKPFNANRLLVTLKNAETNLDLNQKVSAFRSTERSGYCGLIGSSMVMQTLYRTIDSLAASSATGFIVGETGTETELAAKAIHQQSNRARGPFHIFNCADVSRGSIEAELFGQLNEDVENDSDVSNKCAGESLEGLVKASDCGTLFLNEICDSDIEFQHKLLKFIQTGSYCSVGSSKREKASARILCATTKDPLQEVRAGRFSEDLYLRLNVVPIQIPPLRERDEDALLIAQSLLESYSSKESKLFSRFSDAVKILLRNYTWPGNVDELQDYVRKIVRFNSGTVVTEEMLPEPLRDAAFSSEPATVTSIAPNGFQAVSKSFSQIEPLWQIEKQAIQNAISICDGNIIKAADLLEVAPSTIYRKLQTWSEQ